MSEPREFWIKQGYRGERSGTAYPADIRETETYGFIHVREISPAPTDAEIEHLILEACGSHDKSWTYETFRDGARFGIELMRKHYEGK
jgi:hypothetical protein